MARLFENRSRLLAVGLGAFALLLTLEWVTEGDDVNLADFLIDAAALALLVATSVSLTR